MEFLTRLEEAFDSVAQGPFFGGESVGMVDVVLAPLLAWFPAHENIGNFQFQFEEKFPRIHAWISAIQASPCGPCLPPSDKIMDLAHMIRKMYMTSSDH